MDALSDQSQPAKAGMTVLSDDDVVVHRDVERLGGIDELPGHVDIGARWGRVAGRVVVDHAIHYAKTLINKQIM